MSSEYQQEPYPSDYGHYHAPGVSIQSLKERIRGLEERIALLKEIKADGETRLAAQAAEIDMRNREIEEMKEKYRSDLLKNDKTLSDAALSVRTRERKILNLNDQLGKATMAMQRLQLSKHQIVADARKEVLEEMRAEREQRKASLDAQNKASGRSYHNGGIIMSKDTGRRNPSSGSIFSRASTGGGSGGGAANGGSARRAGK